MGTNNDSVEDGDNPVGEVDADDMVEDDTDSSSLSSDSSDDDDDDMNSDNQDESSSKEAKKDDEVDEEDPVIKAILKAKEKKSSNHPPDLVLEFIPSTLSFHPHEDQVAFGNYEGEIIMYGYSVEENKKLIECQHKGHAVRGIAFTHDGNKLVSCYSDQTLKIFDVENDLKAVRTIKNATPAPVSSVYVIDENVFATGDDDGHVLLWDNRSNKNTPNTSLRLGEDAITSMVSNDDRRVLACTSEEGAVYAIKIRAGKVQVESEVYNYEFNCSCVFKQERKLAVGDGKGDVYIFNWDEFGKHSDICTGIGRGEALQAMIPITEKIILCGGDDGFIRAFNFFPQKYLGVVGKVGNPVEKMDVCNDGHLIASIGADETVKFWNVSYFENMTVSGAGGGGGKKGDDGKKEANKTSFKTEGKSKDLTKHNLPSSSHQNAADFFKGLADD